ncbi:hypothetical protein JTB14_018197 [Gonioctena quinquepunctata]|nr:hypothetical protein JTB14_018197 [Gonioctena quinquepunctata]
MFFFRFRQICPKIVFSDVDSCYVTVFLNKICGNSMVFIYNVIMKCPSDAILKNTTEKGDCYEKLTIEVPETLAGITVGTLALTLLFIGIAILGFLKFRSMRRKSAYTYVNYEKDLICETFHDHEVFPVRGTGASKAVQMRDERI